MSKFKKEFKWFFGKDVKFLGYRLGGSWGMYCKQIRHHSFGIYGIVGFTYTVSWGSDFK